MSNPVDLTHIVPPVSGVVDQTRRQLKQGAARNPGGIEISADRYSLLLNERHWMPVMGEIHYTRCHRTGWRDGLLKMKAAGIDIVSTYIFWIHHEEVEGQIDFTGQRSLRDFALLCRELDLHLQVRCGPWSHGECRNGGFPDWLLRKDCFAPVPEEAEKNRKWIAASNQPFDGCGLRSNHPEYLAAARRFYQHLGAQLRGLMWKDGGPVIGIQLENEYPGPSEHLLTLKQLARDAGLDVPLYTCTGWPTPTTPMAFGEFLPLFGGYAEGFWDRNLEPMPGGYWEEFAFKSVRDNATIAAALFGVREAKDEDERDVAGYPFLMCEQGGGMLCSYHRRVRLFTKDVVAPALVKLGCGNSLPGFYVFHGGTNPEGKLSTFNESQATGCPTDVPVKSYDFFAPLGEFSQVREHYHWLRRMNLFIHDCGERLATMTPVFAGCTPAGKNDTGTLRWSVRSDGSSAFIFCNNYQRLQPMPPKPNVQFTLQLKGGDVTVPSRPVTIAADSFFIWPVNIDLGGVNLVYATAEIICTLNDAGIRYVFFSEAAGVPAEFAFGDLALEITSTGVISKKDGRVYVKQIHAGQDVAIKVRTTDGGTLCLVLLDQETSLKCWKGAVGPREHVVLASASLLFEKECLRVQTSGDSTPSIALFPRPAQVAIGGKPSQGQIDGIFARYTLPHASAAPLDVRVEQIKKADSARVVPMGPYDAAEAPTDEEFDRAAVWRVKLPAGLDATRNVLLRFTYAGDVARIYLDGKLLTDNFYNGASFELGLNAYELDAHGGELLINILPLRKDAPIYLLPESWPPEIGPDGIAELLDVEVIESRELRLAVS